MFSRRVTESFNWRYASGEILLIFVGVMLALAASDWYEKRLAHQIEVDILSEIAGSLRNDLGLIKSFHQRYVLLEEKVSDLHEHIRERRPYSPDLDAKFGAFFGFWSTSLDTAAYQALKSESLLLISDPKLRSATLIPVDNVSLILAYGLVNSWWMAPIGIGIGVGLYLVKRKIE